MATYVTLLNFTHEAIEDIEDGPRRLEETKGMFEALNGELKSFYLTMGEYDGVVISEFPDKEVAARAALLIGQALDARTETLQAFDEDEYERLVTDLP